MAVRAVSIALYLPAYVIGLLLIGRKFWRESIFAKERRPFNFYFYELFLAALCMAPSSMLAAHAYHEFDSTEPNSWFWAVAAFALASGTIAGLFIGKVNGETAKSVASGTWRAVANVVYGFMIGVWLAVGLTLVLFVSGALVVLLFVHCGWVFEGILEILGNLFPWPFISFGRKDKKRD